MGTEWVNQPCWWGRWLGWPPPLVASSSCWMLQQASQLAVARVRLLRPGTDAGSPGIADPHPLCGLALVQAHG